jgi:hypothetical protein
MDEAGLISPGPDLRISAAKARGWSIKILKGAHSGDLAVEQPDPLCGEQK